MTRMWTEKLSGWLEWSQQTVLDSVAATAPVLVLERPAPTAPSIAFHAWHLARSADRHQADLLAVLDGESSQGQEIWVARDLARVWGFGDRSLGPLAIGAGLDDVASAALPLPDRDAILDYAGSAFTALIDAIGRIEEDAVLARRIVDLEGEDQSIASVLVDMLAHTSRHLGMIEALRGVFGERGTATI